MSTTLLESDCLLSSYAYDLPSDCIAQEPAHPAHTAKLMVCTLDKENNLHIQDQTFLDLAEQLNPNTLLFFNTTKVFKARIPLQHTKIIRKTGNEVVLEKGEILIYTVHSSTHFEALVSDSKNFKP